MSGSADMIRVVSPVQAHGSWSRMVTDMVRVSHPVIRFAAQFSYLADRVYMPDAHCVLYVARRVGEVKTARARSAWIGGRIYNWLTGSGTEYVQLSGAVLANSLKWLGEAVPEGFARAADLELQFELAEKLDADLRAKAVAEGLIR